MKKAVFSYGLMLCTLCRSVLQADSYPYSSPEALLAFESHQIACTDPKNYALLSERYLDRAETYLICSEYSLAFDDFYNAYKIAVDYVYTTENISEKFRSLFGIALCYAAYDDMDAFHKTTEELAKLLKSAKCCAQSDCVREPTLYLASDSNKNVPIHGPDRISISDCLEFVDGTVNKCRYLIECVPKAEAQVILNIMIDGLAQEAKTCCRKGGIWKACLQPLVNKWYLWNQKWKLFSIPPDPAWD
ncbi:MAG: hypothetical protein RLZZ453_1041 [Chlamydiota bacterium]|jgi:hypothetical protein